MLQLFLQDFGVDDSPDNQIFLKKMICLDFNTSVIKWLEYSLSNRKAFSSFVGVFIEVEILNGGVPQGSI